MAQEPRPQPPGDAGTLHAPHLHPIEPLETVEGGIEPSPDPLVPIVRQSQRLVEGQSMGMFELFDVFGLYAEERPVVTPSPDPMERNPLEALVKLFQQLCAFFTQVGFGRRRYPMICYALKLHRIEWDAATDDADRRSRHVPGCNPEAMAKFADLKRRPLLIDDKIGI